MKLYIKQKVFSWTERFTVKDDTGADRYYVEGEFLSFGKKLHVYDLHGQEVAFVKQECFSFLPRYFVFVDGKQVAEIVREFAFFVPRYTISGLNWNVEGELWVHEYQITKEDCDRPIVTISKEWVTWGDSYELNISDPQDEILALAVVLTIDSVIDAGS